MSGDFWFVDTEWEIVDMYDGEGFSPVSLATEPRITKSVLSFGFAKVGIFERSNGHFCGMIHRHPIEKTTVLELSCPAFIGLVTVIKGSKNIGDGNIKMFCESMI